MHRFARRRGCTTGDEAFGPLGGSLISFGRKEGLWTIGWAKKDVRGPAVLRFLRPHCAGFTRLGYAWVAVLRFRAEPAPARRRKRGLRPVTPGQKRFPPGRWLLPPLDIVVLTQWA